MSSSVSSFLDDMDNERNSIHKPMEVIPADYVRTVVESPSVSEDSEDELEYNWDREKEEYEKVLEAQETLRQEIRKILKDHS